MKNLKTKLQYGLATVAVAAMTAPALADTDLMGAAKAELGGLKAGVLEIGAIVIGIAVAFAVVRVSRRGTNQA